MMGDHIDRLVKRQIMKEALSEVAPHSILILFDAEGNETEDRDKAVHGILREGDEETFFDIRKPSDG